MSSKSKAQLAAENKMLRTTKQIEAWVTLVGSAFRWGAICFLGWQASRALIALAGQNTNADVAISVLGKAEVSLTVMAFVAISGVIYGVRQRTLRRNTVERLQGRIVTLETLLDSKRSSSGLTSRGDTRPEDVL